VITTGANTNVRHEGCIYHVQTEALQMPSPEIVTQVFVGGQILDCFRKPYGDIAEAGESVIGERLSTQHRTVIQAVLRGRLTSAGEVAAISAINPSLVVSPLDDPRIGKSLSVLILLRCESTFEPIAGADIRVSLVDGSSVIAVIHEAATDDRGFHLAEMEVPDAGAADPSLSIEVLSQSGLVAARLPVLVNPVISSSPSPVEDLEEPSLVVSDLGDPRADGQASFMILLRGLNSCRPISGARVRLLFQEGTGKAIWFYEARTDSKGYHLAEVRLPSTDSDEAHVIVEATTESGIAEVVIPVLVA